MHAPRALAGEGFSVRPFRTTDRSAVRAICAATASLGDPVPVAPFYPDGETIADMFTGYFTDLEPESAWVVVGAQGAVVGYLVGALDTRRVTSPYWCALRNIVRRFLWLRPSSAGFWWRALYDMFRDRNGTPPRIDFERFPATAHFNLLPIARTGTVAYDLFDTWKKYARAHGAKGLWSESVVENLRGSRFHRRLGFEPLGEPTVIPGSRTDGGGRLYGQRWIMDFAKESSPLLKLTTREREPTKPAVHP